MKKMLKLAAIAVSTVLAMSFIACSSGDDDVVDASTPKYLLTAQVEKYVASLEYDQNVSDAEIKSLKAAHDDMMKIVGNCEACLTAYFDDLKKNTGTSIETADVKSLVGQLEELKKECDTEKKYHREFVYKPAIENAIEKLKTAERKVGEIGNSNESTILGGKLNDRQSESMNAYLKAVETLKDVLDKDDAKKCEGKIKAADGAIKAFGELKNVTKDEIKKVTDAVGAMSADISSKVLGQSQGNDDSKDENED